MKVINIFTPSFFSLLSQKGSALFQNLFPADEHKTFAICSILYGSFPISKNFEEAAQAFTVDDLAGLFYSLYGDSWERIAETLTAVYNPVENYSKIFTETTERDKGKETETTTPTGGSTTKTTQNGSFTTTTENQTAPYNSETYKNTDKSTTTTSPGAGFYTNVETTATAGANTKKETDHENVSRETENFGTITGDEIELHRIVETGNIGIQTGAEMAEKEINLRVKNIFLKQVISDIVNFAISGVDIV